MVFTNVFNPRSAISRKNEYLSTKVGKGATIGANATIVCGNAIGAYSFIGAGAVVTKDVPDYALVIGNPSRQTGWMSEYGHKLAFDGEGKANCPESGEEYLLQKGKVRKSNPLRFVDRDLSGVWLPAGKKSGRIYRRTFAKGFFQENHGPSEEETTHDLGNE